MSDWGVFNIDTLKSTIDIQFCDVPEQYQKIFCDATKYTMVRFDVDMDFNLEIVFDKDAEYAGECTTDQVGPCPSMFTIILNPDDSSATLSSFLHETVHLKQMLTGQLIENSDVAIWYGKRYDISDPNYTKEQYFMSPWEIEAYGAEIGLFVGFANTYPHSIPEELL